METNEAHYAINLTKLSRSGNHVQSTYAEELQVRIAEFREQGLSVKAVLNPLLSTGIVFGPFENKRGAVLMAASELDDQEKDYFGTRWAFICVEMTDTDYQKPLLERARVFVCSDKECGAVQRFKGSCSSCKANGKSLVRTIEVRDWDGVLQ